MAGIPAVASGAQRQQAVFDEAVATDAYVSVVPSGSSGNKAIVDIATGEFSGVVTGAFVETDYFTLHANGTGTFHGVDTCTCTIDGRVGSLVIRYTGTMAADGSFVSPFVIVEASGELTGLEGHGISTGVFTGVAPYSFTNSIEYHFSSVS